MVDFPKPDTISYKQPLDMIPAYMERNKISDATPIKLFVRNFLQIIPKKIHIFYLKHFAF